MKHRQSLAAPLALAIALHAVVLLIKFNFVADVARSGDPLLVGILNEPVEKESAKDEPNSQIEPPRPVESIKPTPALTFSPPPEQESVDTKTSNVTVTPATVVVTSIHSDEFKRFLDNENKQITKADALGLNNFEQTFVRSAPPEYKDSKPEPDQLLGGGNYKTVRNGIECESLKMVPQSFDELSGLTPTLTTKGRCKDLNTKIRLTDKDGKIQNSDRVDWP